MKQENEEDIRHKLRQECAMIEWPLLKPHYERDALIIVQKDMDIVSVGLEVATNNQPLIQQWIDNQSLIKPTAEQVATWEQHPILFKSLVVAPFVLMQIISH